MVSDLMTVILDVCHLQLRATQPTKASLQAVFESSSPSVQGLSQIIIK